MARGCIVVIAERGTLGYWQFDVQSSVAAGVVTFSIDGISYRLDLRTGSAGEAVSLRAQS